MNRHVMRWFAVSILCAGLGGATGALAQETNNGREISIVVEEGDRVPSQVLDALAAQQLRSGTTANVTFSVIEGEARLAGANGETVDATSGGAAAHPEIVPGPTYDETYVRMLADGQPMGRPIRVGTIASGSLDQLLEKDVPAGSEALLTKASDYAVVDTGLLRSKAPVEEGEAPTGQYCTTILDKERNVYGHSRVLAKGCSDQSQENALAQAQSKASDSGTS